MLDREVADDPDQKDRQTRVKVGRRGRTAIATRQVTQQGVEWVPLPRARRHGRFNGSIGFTACIGIDRGHPTEDFQHRREKKERLAECANHPTETDQIETPQRTADHRPRDFYRALR